MTVAANVIVNSLAERDFEGVERMTHGRWMTAAEMEQAVGSIPGTLIRPPVASYDRLAFEPVGDSERPTFETQVPLWTSEAGKTATAVTLRFCEHELIPATVQVEIVASAHRHGTDT